MHMVGGRDRQACAGTSGRRGESHETGERLSTDLKTIVSGDLFSRALSELKESLSEHQADTGFEFPLLYFTRAHATYKMLLSGPVTDTLARTSIPSLPVDQIIRAPRKIAALILGRLGANRTIFARNCKVERLDKKEANGFLEQFHLWGATNHMLSLGLFHTGKLVAIASFSKGRKMRRLKADERSYEMIRFCTAAGITVTGGLSKLVKAFCELKNAAEVMTYVDLQFADGSSFEKAGFKAAGNTEPLAFLVSTNTFERTPYLGQKFSRQQYYIETNAGNQKMLFTCRQA